MSVRQEYAVEEINIISKMINGNAKTDVEKQNLARCAEFLKAELDLANKANNARSKFVAVAAITNSPSLAKNKNDVIKTLSTYRNNLSHHLNQETQHPKHDKVELKPVSAIESRRPR